MRKFSILLTLVACAAAAGCSAPAQQTFCIVDGIAQPIVVTLGTVAAGLAGQGELAGQAAGADNKVHAAVQGACQAIGASHTIVANTDATMVPVTTNAATAAAVAAAK